MVPSAKAFFLGKSNDISFLLQLLAMSRKSLKYNWNKGMIIRKRRFSTIKGKPCQWRVSLFYWGFAGFLNF
jgi:hypothetical protein